jgi:isocitrate lyase
MTSTRSTSVPCPFLPHLRDLPAERFAGIVRDYTPADVAKLRGSVLMRHTLAEIGSQRLWQLLHKPEHTAALGALTGNQAVQQVKAGLQAIYLSGWQVAADANLSGHMYPDQSLYPSNSVPQVVKRINQALQRADQIAHMEGKGDKTHWFAPIVADAEAGFGGPLNAFELMKLMIEAGAAGVHFEDQLASEKKCGHLGGKVLVPTQTFVRTLNAARLAADVSGVPTVLVARTDADAAGLITSDVDERDRQFLTGERTNEASSSSSRACRRRSRAASPTRRTRTWSGARPATPISARRSSSPKRSTSSSPASCWPTTARHRSTGRRTSTTARSRASSAN